MKVTRGNSLIAYAVIALSLLLTGGCAKKVVNNYYYNYYGFPYTEKAVNYSGFGNSVDIDATNPSALYDVQSDIKESQVVEAAILTIKPIKKIESTIVAKVGELTLQRDEPLEFEPLPEVEKKPASVVPEITPKTAVPLALIVGGMSFMFLARNRRKRTDLAELTEDEWRGLKFFWKFLEGSLKKRGKL